MKVLTEARVFSPSLFCWRVQIRSSSPSPILLSQSSPGTANLLGVLGVSRVPCDNIPSLQACVCCVIQTLIFSATLLLRIVCETWDYLDRG